MIWMHIASYLINDDVFQTFDINLRQVAAVCHGFPKKLWSLSPYCLGKLLLCGCHVGSK